MSSSMASTMHLLTAVWYQFLVAPSLYRWDKAAVFLWLFRINATCLFFSTLDHIFAVSSPADDGSETIVGRGRCHQQLHHRVLSFSIPYPMAAAGEEDSTLPFVPQFIDWQDPGKINSIFHDGSSSSEWSRIIIYRFSPRHRGGSSIRKSSSIFSLSHLHFAPLELLIFLHQKKFHL